MQEIGLRGMGRAVVFQLERTVYAETLKRQGGSACSREGRGAAVPGPVRTGECGWCEMRLDRWPEARSRGDLEAVVTSLGEL